MTPNVLNLSTTIQCPHGGRVQVVNTNYRVKADSVYALLASDTYTVAGCPFTLPTTPPKYSPCVSVQWVLPTMRLKIGGNQVLTETSQGLCKNAESVPQGKAIVVNTQLRAGAQ